MFEEENNFIDDENDLEDELEITFQEEFHDAERSPPASPER